MNILLNTKYLISIILLILMNSNVAHANITNKKEIITNEIEKTYKKEIKPSKEVFTSNEADQYILGPGDTIFISIGKQLIESFFKVTGEDEEDTNIPGSYSGNYEIAPDGTIFLPRINNVYVEGLTLKDLKELLNAEYKKYLRFPEISLKMITYRNVRIFVDGEVPVPGYYDLPRGETKALPTVYDGLKKSGGININADLSNVEIIRIIPRNNGGGKKKTRLNLLKLVDGDDYSDNIRIYDGDIIKVNRTSEMIPEQIKRINKTNLSPTDIDVFVLGRMTNPGMITLPKGSSVNEAILVGNPKVLKGKVEFIRLDKYKKSDRRIFSYKPNAVAGSYQNPILMNGDIVRIRHNILSATTEVVGEVAQPFVGVYSLINLIEDFTD